MVAEDNVTLGKIKVNAIWYHNSILLMEHCKFSSLYCIYSNPENITGLFELDTFGAPNCKEF